MLNKEKPVNVKVDRDKCIVCGICADICTVNYLSIDDNQVKTNDDSVFGCVQCGYCMMHCPKECISIEGEGISPDDVVPLEDNLPGYDSVYSLFIQRRSTRKFVQQELQKEVIEKIIEAASTAPISIPPSEVKVLVISGFDKVRTFADEIIERLEKFAKMMNPFVLGILSPFMGRAKYKMFRDFILPLVGSISKGRREGEDLLFYDAPAVMVFYGTELTDKEDAILAAAHAYIAAEALGLGTCIIGSVPPAFDVELKKKYGIEKNETPVIAFILGYPESKPKRGIKRRFKAVNYF